MWQSLVSFVGTVVDVEEIDDCDRRPKDEISRGSLHRRQDRFVHLVILMLLDRLFWKVAHFKAKQ